MGTFDQLVEAAREWMDYGQAYTVMKRWFLYVPVAVFPVTLFYDAPFGRFSTPNSILAVDGIKSWMVMEIISPLTFIATLTIHPFSRFSFLHPPTRGIPNPSIQFTPQALLALLFLTHYTNRALISPLRTPGRSPSSLLVVAAAFMFNIPNGFMLAAYLSSDSARSYLSGAFSRPKFWIGFAMWAFGFVGNIVHDEILMNIRRKANAKGKAKDNSAIATNGQKQQQQQQHHYAIPHGLLYTYISYPNYFCEWVEWLGFAIAASPAPDFSLLPSPSTLISLLGNGEVAKTLGPFADSVSPPWVFLAAEVLTMVPRAVRGHLWYQRKFGESYPKERKIVVPFLF